MPKNRYLPVYLLIAFTIETLCVTFLLLDSDLAEINTVLYFISGLSIALIILFLPQAKKITLAFNKNTETYLKYGLIIIAGIILCFFSLSIMNDIRSIIITQICCP